MMAPATASTAMPAAAISAAVTHLAAAGITAPATAAAAMELLRSGLHLALEL